MAQELSPNYNSRKRSRSSGIDAGNLINQFFTSGANTPTFPRLGSNLSDDEDAIILPKNTSEYKSQCDKYILTKDEENYQNSLDTDENLIQSLNSSKKKQKISPYGNTKDFMENENNIVVPCDLFCAKDNKNPLIRSAIQFLSQYRGINKQKMICYIKESHKSLTDIREELKCMDFINSRKEDIRKMIKFIKNGLEKEPYYHTYVDKDYIYDITMKYINSIKN